MVHSMCYQHPQSVVTFIDKFEFFQEVLSLKHKYGKLKILIQIKLKMLHIYDVGGASSTLLFMLLLLAYLDNT